MRGTQFAELSAFVAVAERGSFTKAAKELGIATATLSQSIRDLEEKLGVRLLNRTTRRVAPSAVGERLLARLRPVLDDYAAAIESVNEFRGKPCGRLRITVPPPVAEFVLAPKLARFIAEYPDIQLEILSEAGLTDIVAERFDAGIRFGRKLEKDMVAVKIHDGLAPILAAAPSYLAAHGLPERPKDLRGHKGIRFRFPSGLLPWRFEKKGRVIEAAPETSIIVNEPPLAVKLAVDGVGVLYFGEDYLAAPLKDGRLVRLLPDWIPATDSAYLYYPSRHQNPAALQALIDFLKTERKAERG